MLSGVTKRVKDTMSVYYDERKFRTELIENSRKTMENIMKKVEDIDRRRGNVVEEVSEFEEPLDEYLTDAEETDSVASPQPNVVEEDPDKEHDNSFALWLKSISQCLSNKISDDPVAVPVEEEEDEPDEEDIDEDERCMKVVTSVFDEETATEVIKSYLNLLRNTELPEKAKITFKHCHFESDSGKHKIFRT